MTDQSLAACRADNVPAAWADLRVDCERWTTLALIGGLLVGIFLLSMGKVVMLALACSLLVFSGYAWRRPLHWVILAVLANFLIWLASGLLSGGFAWGFIRSAEFWRGEGRCFLFYVPVLVLSLMRLRVRDLRVVVQFLAVLTAIGLGLAILWFAGYGTWFQAHVDQAGQLDAGNYFIGFQTSHTGAGAFWGTIAAFLAAFALRTKHRVMQACAATAVLLTLATGSRAATLGLLGVAGWLLVRGDLWNRRSWTIAVPVMVTAVLGGSLVMAYAPEISERMAEVFESSTFESVSTAAEQPTLQNAAGHFLSGSHLPNHNLVIRVFLWKYAMRLFQESPILGVGFGRFNDTDLRFSGIPGVLQLAVAGERFTGCGIRWDDRQRMTSVGNAHNSYLHILAETGLLGLVATWYLWANMWRYAQPRPQDGSLLAQAFGNGCQAAILCLLVMALFGHALAAPSGGIPVTTLMGTWLAYRNGQG